MDRRSCHVLFGMAWLMAMAAKSGCFLASLKCSKFHYSTTDAGVRQVSSAACSEEQDGLIFS